MKNNLILGIVGTPVFQSRSPDIHETALRVAEIPGCSVRLAAMDAKEAVDLARELGLRGLNVTAPFKESIVQYLDSFDPVVAATRAVNTILFENGHASGFNTDAGAVEKLMVRAGRPLRGEPCAVIGAGGAAKAAAYALTALGAEVTVLNRSPERAAGLSRQLQVKIAPLSEAHSVLSRTVAVVNTVPAERILPPDFSFRQDQILLDANYALETDIVRAARSCGATVYTGRDWLLEQGALACSIFLNKKIENESLSGCLSAPRSGKKSVALIGMMGSGKSAASAELGRLLGLPSYDTDELICLKEGCAIADIFANGGEARFRAIESECLEKALAGPPAVIACGGGAVLSASNREILKKEAHSVWLFAPVSTLLQRVDRGQIRPLLQGADRGARLEELFAARLPYYTACSDMVLRTDVHDPQEIAQRIYNEIRYAG